MKALGVTNEFKWVAAGIVAVAALGLAGCGKKGAPQPPPDEPNTYPRTYPSG